LRSSVIVGHSSFQKTYASARCYFFWAGLKKDILQFVTKCEVCQRNKGETVKSPGILQPLPIPSFLWIEISMDSIVSLPKDRNKSFIMVVADILSNYAHFFPLPHPFTPSLVTQVFLDHIFKLHGMQTSIVSDRDPTFANTFWKELFKLQGTQLNISTSYHPHYDGQMEVVNKYLETYLHFFPSKKRHQWVKWFPLAEWWYNTSYHTTTKMTPYEVVYGKSPQRMTTYLPGTSKVQSIDTRLQGCKSTLVALKDNLHMAQNRMKQQGNQNRLETVFQEGDQVFISIQTYKKTSLKAQGHHKLAPKFYEP
jgi:hypothetical protein